MCALCGSSEFTSKEINVASPDKTQFTVNINNVVDIYNRTS